MSRNSSRVRTNRNSSSPSPVPAWLPAPCPAPPGGRGILSPSTYSLFPGRIWSRLPPVLDRRRRSEEDTSELQSLMRISYAVFCLKKKKKDNHNVTNNTYKHILVKLINEY